MTAITKAILEPLWGPHPARTIPFDQLYENLLDHVNKRNLVRVIKEDLELFNYTVHAQFNTAWDVFTLISRGLIVAPSEKRVVATPFPKFFNYGETQIWGADQAPGETLVTAKYDGSLGITFFHKGQWQIATRGSFRSEQALWATQWFHEHVNWQLLEKGHTYLFEIIYRKNKIVVSYDFEGLVLLGGYFSNGEELSHTEVQSLGKQLQVRVCENYTFQTIDSLATSAKTLAASLEGWVVRFPNGHRLKIKGDEYCRLHRLISSVTPLTLWEIMLQGDDLDGLRKEIPEEHLSDFNHIQTILEGKLSELLTAAHQAYEKAKPFTDKEVGLAFKSGQWPNGARVAPIERKFIFSARKNDFFEQVKVGGSRQRKMAFDTFRPTGNDLEGYTPSTSLNRFIQENQG